MSNISLRQIDAGGELAGVEREAKRGVLEGQEPVRNGQAQAGVGARGAAGRVFADEALEQAGQVAFGQVRGRVGNGDDGRDGGIDDGG